MFDHRRWQRYADHRAHVHEAIASARQSTDGSIALVGAGKSYDADLIELVVSFGRVAVVDIDADLVRQGIEGQGAATIQAIAPFDVAAHPALPEQFDGVVSQCLLSQLVATCVADPVAVEATRTAHLRFLLDSVKPGGWAIVVWDVVASETTPELLNGSWTRRTVERIAERAFAAGNYFTGLAPGLLLKSLETDPWLKKHCAGYQPHRPWVWHDEPDHARIVYALTLRRT